MEARICDITTSNQESKQNKSVTQTIKKNDIVTIYDEKVPRHLWRLRRVVDIIPSRDCNIRAGKIKVGKTGAIINRPINKLYSLKCSMTYDTEDNVNKVKQQAHPEEKNISLSHVILFYRNVFIARGDYVRLSW